MLAACADHAPAGDPYLWLEDVNSPRAQAWVASENAKTVNVLEKDPRFADFKAQVKTLGEATDRIPMPNIHSGAIYNFWQDADHVRGIWRTTSQADYASPNPTWTTVLDLDAVARTEGKNWVWEGADCSSPSENRCLISLSEGGEDAHTIREFDLTTRAFVPGGFELPHGKQSAVWADDDTLLVAREWQPGEMTSSGYPYVTKRLHRGQALAEATEVARGTATDVNAEPVELDDSSGHRVLLSNRSASFFENEYRFVGNSTPLGLPKKASPVGLVDGRMLIELDEAWSSFGTGSLVSVDLAAAQHDPQHLAATLVYSPGPRESLGSVAITRDQVLVSSLRNVRGHIAVYTPMPDNGWSSRDVALPDNATVTPVTADPHGTTAYVSVTSFLQPTELWQVDTRSGQTGMAKTTPARFDASHEVVEQQEATSTDGTKIPYFIVHPAGMAMDGSHPTILNAYGGFASSETPFYSGALGKLWLEHGGVFVLANIRGGGEFGPAWHEAGLKTHRQRIYDDFASVAHDLIDRKVTSPRRLGIEGGSNGGLLMGVEFTQHPDLFNAVDMQVPLLDMMRYEQIAAGSSWVGEYGSVSNPDERAFLASISPYQNLKAGVKYPEPLIWTTTKDDRVGPQHARKFAAKLAELGDPYLFYEVTEGGHGSGANVDETAHTTALEYTYFSQKLLD